MSGNTPEPRINQCDGCQRGLPTRASKHGSIMHDDEDGLPVMICTKDRYVGEHPIADRATDAQKSRAYEWLRSVALGEEKITGKDTRQGLAALAVDEWHRLTTVTPSAGGASEPCQRLGCRFEVAQAMLHRAKERGELTEAEASLTTSATRNNDMRRVLEQALEKLRLYRAHQSGEYVGGMEYTALVDAIEKALATDRNQS